MKVKFCSLRRKEDIEYANLLLPDYAGFILSPGFKRSVEIEKAAELIENLNEKIIAVGVFVDESVDFIAKTAKITKIQAIQLHGSESDETIKQIQNITKLPVIKAFKIKSSDDVEKAKSSLADIILLDGGAGSGKSFDYSLINQVGRPFVLAGGLDDKTIAKAIRQTRPFGVDVSSGVETDGKKDFEKLSKFIKTAREYEQY